MYPTSSAASHSLSISVFLFVVDVWVLHWRKLIVRMLFHKTHRLAHTIVLSRWMVWMVAVWRSRRFNGETMNIFALFSVRFARFFLFLFWIFANSSFVDLVRVVCVSVCVYESVPVERVCSLCMEHGNHCRSFWQYRLPWYLHSWHLFSIQNQQMNNEQNDGIALALSMMLPLPSSLFSLIVIIVVRWRMCFERIVSSASLQLSVRHIADVHIVRTTSCHKHIHLILNMVHISADIWELWDKIFQNESLRWVVAQLIFIFHFDIKMRKNVAIGVAAAAAGSCSDVYTQHNRGPEIETIKIIASVVGLNCS